MLVIDIFEYIIRVLKGYFEIVVKGCGLVYKYENVFFVLMVFVIWFEFVKEFMKKVVIKVDKKCVI